MTTARSEGLVGCTRCLRTSPLGTTRCPTCGNPLHQRHPHSLQATWAYLLTAVLCYVPANTLPIMETTQLGSSTASNIIGGVRVLWSIGSYPTAAIIFVASVVIPIAKILAIGWLAWRTGAAGAVPAQRHSQLFMVVEAIGTWSMIDVFVVALLVALVRFTGLLTIDPGPAALAFCGMVIFTLLAARAYDTRLMWDRST